MKKKHNVFKNKKSLMLETLVRVIIVVVAFLFIVFPACNKIKAVFYGNKDLDWFNDFIDSINNLEEGKKPVFLKLKVQRAIVGFNSKSDAFEYYRSFDGPLTSIFKKPDALECEDKSCICLCRSDIKQVNDKLPFEFTCSIIYCKSINVDIMERIQVGNVVYWKGGFLIGRNIKVLANGLIGLVKAKERIELIVEKKKYGDKVYLGVFPAKAYEGVEGSGINEELIVTP